MKDNYSTIVSSRVTFVYKYIIPLFALISMIMLCYFRWPYLTGLEKLLFPAMIWTLGLLSITPLVLLQEVYFTDDFFVASGLLGSRQFSHSQIVNIDKFVIFYMITIKAGKTYHRILFLPHILDFIENLGGETRGVVKWRNLLRDIEKNNRT